MSSLPPNDPPTDFNKTNPSIKHPLIKGDIDLFSRQFETAVTNIEYEKDSQKNKPTASKSAPLPNETEATPPLPMPLFEATDALQELFPNMGLANIQRIDALFAFTSQAISEATAAPATTPQTFVISFDQSKCLLNVRIQHQEHNRQIQLNCNPALHQLLLPYMPELKAYLKKRNISFEDLTLVLDDTLDNASHPSLKNNGSFQKK
jgi:hypothetical protein